MKSAKKHNKNSQGDAKKAALAVGVMFLGMYA